MADRENESDELKPQGNSETKFDPWVTKYEDAAAPADGITSSVRAFQQWNAAQYILAKRSEMEAFGPAVLEGVSLVLQHGLIAPDWLVAAYQNRWRQFTKLEALSLDVAFDVPKRTARNAKAVQRHADLIPKVSKALCHAIYVNPDRPIDQGLFEEVGAQFSIGKVLCEELYRLGVRHYRQADLKVLKEMFAEMAKPNLAQSEISAGLHRRT